MIFVNFKISNSIERRSDNSNLAGYKVSLNNKHYIVYYDGNELREVYFMFYSREYFMSCRPDMKTIHHYYVVKNTIKRYENGVLNQVYLIKDKGEIVCMKDNQLVTYKQYYGIEHSPETQEKIYNDLVNFIDKFNSLELNHLFSPERPWK